MGLFSAILDKLGLTHHTPTPAPTTPTAAVSTAPRPTAPASAPQAVAPRPPVPTTPTPAAPAQAVKPAVQAMSQVDVVKKLEKLSEGSGLDWKVSIVDLLKLLELESSLPARKELATELGCPPDLMNDSAKMNVWLHKTVLQKIAENGGNIPASMLN